MCVAALQLGKVWWHTKLSGARLTSPPPGLSRGRVTPACHTPANSLSNERKQVFKENPWEEATETSPVRCTPPEIANTTGFLETRWCQDRARSFLDKKMSLYEHFNLVCIKYRKKTELTQSHPWSNSYQLKQDMPCTTSPTYTQAVAVSNWRFNSPHIYKDWVQTSALCTGSKCSQHHHLSFQQFKTGS